MKTPECHQFKLLTSTNDGVPHCENLVEQVVDSIAGIGCFAPGLLCYSVCRKCDPQHRSRRHHDDRITGTSKWFTGSTHFS